jgi:hypothetical protein
MEGYQVNGLAFAEFRFKRDWESKRGGWVQGRSVASDGWHSIKYCRSVKAADRYVSRVIARRQEPVQYVELPLVKAIS